MCAVLVENLETARQLEIYLNGAVENIKLSSNIRWLVGYLIRSKSQRTGVRSATSDTDTVWLWFQVHHSEWHQALTGVSRREMMLVAAKVLAGLYKNSIRGNVI